MTDDEIMNAIVYFSAQEKAWKKCAGERHYTVAIAALKYTLANTNLITKIIHESL